MKQLTKNVSYNLGERTLLITVKDDDGNLVDCALFRTDRGKIVKCEFEEYKSEEQTIGN